VDDDSGNHLTDAFANARNITTERDPIVERMRGNVRHALLGKVSPPPRIDRFEILECIGAGGMGVVYAAHDPKLDRTIALKVLNGRAAHGRARLLDEARALARLSHPNVVAVYDADVVGDDVFIAMELVRGKTARDWSPASWREAVAVYREAGRGLAAAHAAGIVHGDFKPANVIIGDDGRVRVLDFGLARDDSAADVSDASAGTPAYMAPEQRAGSHGDTRSDQYGFCVSLYEAIHGHRPPTTPSDVRRQRHLHPRVREALARGLDQDPGARFPSMEALLDALDVPRPRTRRWLALAAAVAVVGGGSFAVAWRHGAAANPCAAGSTKVAGAWNERHAAAVRHAFETTGRAHARDSATLVVTQLDGYAAAMQDAHRAGCEIARTGTEPARVTDLRARCLARRLDAVAALVDVFEHADAAVVDNAVQAVHALPAVVECERSDALLARTAAPEDPDAQRRLDDAAAALARANALHDAGKYKDASAIASDVLATARAVGHAPLEAEALYLVGVLQSKQGTAAAAEVTFRECTQAAERGRDDALAAHAWIRLAQVVTRQAHFDEGIRAADQARAKIERVPDRDAIGAFLDLSLGLLYLERGSFDAARPLLVHALERYEAIDPDRPRVVTTLNAIAALHAAAGANADSLAAANRALATAERVLGPSHPVTASALKHVAIALGRLGQHDRAIEVEERALAILRDTHGPDSDAVAGLQHNLGVDYLSARRFDEAEPRFREAIRIREKLFGPDHAVLAMSYGSLGSTLLDGARAADAMPLFERALAITTKAYGDGDARTSLARYRVGNALVVRGAYDDAIRELTRTRDAFAKSLGADSAKVAMVETTLAQALVGKRRGEDAVRHFERSIAIYERTGPPLDLANARWFLAKALWDLRRDRPRALALATSARSTYAAAGVGYAALLRDVDDWLAARQ